MGDSALSLSIAVSHGFSAVFLFEGVMLPVPRHLGVACYAFYLCPVLALLMVTKMLA
jgi:hypothetical protein